MTVLLAVLTEAILKTELEVSGALLRTIAPLEAIVSEVSCVIKILVFIVCLVYYYLHGLVLMHSVSLMHLLELIGPVLFRGLSGDLHSDSGIIPQIQCAAL